MASEAVRAARAEARGQFAMLRLDVAIMLAGDRRGLLTCWTHPRFWAVVCYRVERFAFLLSGRCWPLLEPCLKVGLAPLRPGGVEISCRARIGGGLAIYHPGLGVVIGPQTEAGDHLVLTGGNCIGVRRVFRPGERLILGDRVVLAVGAVILGPVRLGDDVWVGAGAIADRDVPSRSVVRAQPSTVTSRPPTWGRPSSTDELDRPT